MAISPCRLRSLIYLIITALFGYFVLTKLLDGQKSIWKRDQISPDELLLILVWTKCWPWLRLDSILENCPPHLRCKAICNRSLIDNVSAILFHINALDWADIPRNRRSDQYYIFALWGSPRATNKDLTQPGHRDFFNLTFTYRLDSDAPWPYGEFAKAPLSETPKDLTKVVQGTTELVAWFVGHCVTSSGREKFVQELKKYVQVDIYGTCGNLKCPREIRLPKTGIQDASGCHRLLTKDYKFYLSLENAICRGYITEKLYRAVDDSIVVPIVFERKLVLDTVKDEEVKKMLNKSFIAIDDFPNVADLVSYLRYVDGNMTAYMEYFEWRKEHQVIQDDTTERAGCGHCRVLHEKKGRTIEDMSKWWTTDANCHSYMK